MICRDIICEPETCKCLPEGDDVTTFFKGWIVGLAVILLTGCGVVGYYLGGVAKAKEMHKVCQTGELFTFRHIDGEYTCFRLDVEE